MASSSRARPSPNLRSSPNVTQTLSFGFMTDPDLTSRTRRGRVPSPAPCPAVTGPRLGRMGFANVGAGPYPQGRTVVVLTDNGSLSTAPIAANFSGEVYVYVGTKTTHGHPVEQAGLTNGTLFGIAVTVGGHHVTEESNAFGLGDATTGYLGAARFSLYDLGDVSALGALELEQASIDGRVTRFRRPEDGAWDPRRRHHDDFYFVTTASLTSNCRLWRLRFDDVEHPEHGGALEILLHRDQGHGMRANWTIDRCGRSP